MNIRALDRAPRDIPEALVIAPFTRRPKRHAIAEGGYLRDGAMLKRYDHRAARIPIIIHSAYVVVDEENPRQGNKAAPCL
jgi:hypothetical protein